jgi:hypothetical protein
MTIMMVVQASWARTVRETKGTTMARTKAGGAAARGVSAKATSKDRVAVIMLKGRPEYRDWINELAEQARMPASVLIDHALAEKAERLRFRPPPPR